MTALISHISPTSSFLTDKKPIFPTEAIIAAVVVVTLTIFFGIVARRDKIFKVWKALVFLGKNGIVCCSAWFLSTFSILFHNVAFHC